MDDNDMEIEVFSSDDIILVELICDTLEKANIEYVRTQNGTGMEGFLKIYNAKIVDDEIPEELKNEN